MFDVTFLGALGAGLLSFLSPCVLPIVPFYLSYLAGVGMNQISAGAEVSNEVRWRAFLSSSLFALGVIHRRQGLLNQLVHLGIGVTTPVGSAKTAGLVIGVQQRFEG